MQWKVLGRVLYLSRTAVSLLAGAGILLLAAVGYALFSDRKTSVVWTETACPEVTVVSAPPETDGNYAAERIETPVLWRVYVVGAVRNPGFYSLEQGALVYDAVTAAGGLLPEAEADTVNLAQELGDGFMIKILTKAERLEQKRSSGLVLIKNNVEISGGQMDSVDTEGLVSGQGRKININSASKEELMQLPGIGETKAESIITYRKNHGPFQSIEDIMLVSGIKESGFEKIKDRITT